MNKEKTYDLSRFILSEERKHPNATGSLSYALNSISTSAKIISSKIRRAGLEEIIGKHGTINGHQEEVQKLDMIANDYLITHLRSSGQFYALASEENENAIFPEEGKEGKYIIAFDPLDGSSNIDVNINIGTIFSIHKKIKGDESDFFQRGREQVAAGYIIYGPSTMFVYSTGDGVNGFTLDPMMGLFLLSHPNIKIPENGNIYSINEGNKNAWEGQLSEKIELFKDLGYKSRYVGSMVADVHRTLIKGGLFMYPGDKKSPDGKLRLLYEASPMAFLFENANGFSFGTDSSILDIVPTDLHQRTPVFLGEKKLYERIK